MSRIDLPVKADALFEDRKVANLTVGLDKPMGHWFFQLWGHEDDPEQPAFCDHCTYEGTLGSQGLCPVCDHSLFVDEIPMNEEATFGCSKGQLLDALAKYAEASPLTEAVTRCVALDLDPEGVCVD